MHQISGSASAESLAGRAAAGRQSATPRGSPGRRRGPRSLPAMIVVGILLAICVPASVPMRRRSSVPQSSNSTRYMSIR